MTTILQPAFDNILSKISETGKITNHPAGVSGSRPTVDISHAIEKTGPEVEPARPTSLPVGQYADLRDTQHLIKSKPGMFWCYSHLQDIPLEKQSPDPRYCQPCYELLMQEAKDTGIRHGKRAPWWMPADKIIHQTSSDVVLEGRNNMSTVKAKKSTVDKLDPSAPVRPIVHPGPKNKILPMDLIKQLVSEGQGSKMIAKRLTSDGIPVSYKTIQRLLNKASYGN